MTAELRDGIAHAQVFERIAELTRAGGYLGASALVPPLADEYVRAVEAVFAGQQHQKRSHVHKVILAALRGEFGATAPHTWLSALAAPCSAEPHTFAPGITATRIALGVDAATGGPACADLVHIDLARFRARLLTATHEGAAHPAPAWRETFHLAAVINAGMFHD